MSFITALALALSVLVVAPTLAHLLRRGRVKEQAFPPAGLVPVTRASARERSRLEDRGLLLLRALMILCLAVLGAGPLVRCSRVALGRSGGASVALALVVDDSASMRVRLPDGKTRFQRAVEGARELLASAREGDAVALVQAGKPARITLAASTDLGAVARALAALEPTDRATDLGAAIALGRAALGSLPHQDKRVVLLSDLAGDFPTEGGGVWAALPELAGDASDCGVLKAEQNGQRISATLACSSEGAAQGRSLHLLGKDGASEGEARLVVQRGTQTVTLDAKADAETVALSGSDQNPDDDRAPVAPEGHGSSLAVYADSTQEAVVTGGAPVLEQALHALPYATPVRPLSELPREEGDLRDVAALFIDDPPGLTPETRGAIDGWLEGGAVATLFVGPRAPDTQLGATLEPFARGAVDWEQPLTGNTGVDIASFNWLGSEADSLKDLSPKGRARLDTALVPGAEVVGRWSDGKALVTRQERGRGLLFSVGLPVSVDLSDFALRPAFLALLDQMVGEALRRRGPRESEAGTEWWFPASGNLQVSGKGGPLTPREADGQRVVTPETTGRYRISLNGKTETRFITLPADEILSTPKRELPSGWRRSQTGAPPQVDASPELGWLLLGLLGLELGVRVARLWRERRAQGAIEPSPS